MLLPNFTIYLNLSYSIGTNGTNQELSTTTGYRSAIQATARRKRTFAGRCVW